VIVLEMLQKPMPHHLPGFWCWFIICWKVLDTDKVIVILLLIISRQFNWLEDNGV